MTTAPDPELEVLFRIAQSVHQTVRQSMTSPHRADVVAMGADGSPTEELDRVAEGQILSVLEAEGVDWDLLSEEVGLVRRGGDRLLVVDPIDGSHNALRSMPFSTISIALGTRDLDGIEKGVVRDLFRGTTYWATRGHGAYRDGHRISVRPWEVKSELFFVNLGRHSTPAALELAERGRRIRSLGCASLEMAMVAQGSADAYLFENDTAERNLRVTDIAAGYRLLLEAGGGVTDASGRPIGSVPLDLAQHTSVLAFGDPHFVASRQGAGPK
ncbi:MAG TPA: inositol monophosphatase family protein [Thermoplasmata archaeon]